MSERPIEFQGEPLRAILAGRKTQTRLPVPGPLTHLFADLASGALRDRCPFGQVGDRLWLRENFAPVDRHGHKCKPTDAAFVVLPDGAKKYRDGHYSPPLPAYLQGLFDGIKWRPSIDMPRWASRLTLEVTAVRVAPLWSISQDDARAEGVDPSAWHGAPQCGDNAVGAFCELWDRLNGEHAPWDSNPWVWIVSFKRLEAPHA